MNWPLMARVQPLMDEKKLLKFFVSSHLGRSLKRTCGPSCPPCVFRDGCSIIEIPGLAGRTPSRTSRSTGGPRVGHLRGGTSGDGSQGFKRIIGGFLEFLNIFDGIFRVANF